MKYVTLKTVKLFRLSIKPVLKYMMINIVFFFVLFFILLKHAVAARTPCLAPHRAVMPRGLHFSGARLQRQALLCAIRFDLHSQTQRSPWRRQEPYSESLVCLLDGSLAPQWRADSRWSRACGGFDDRTANVQCTLEGFHS